MGIVKKTLLGKELVFTEEMDLFNSIRKKYILLSKEARQKAEEEYNGKITGYSEYRSYMKSIMDELFEQYLTVGVHDIIGYDIYDIDEVVLREEFEKDFGCTYREEIDHIVGQLAQIDVEQAVLDEERKEAIEDARLVDGALVSGNAIDVIGSKLGMTLMNAVAKGGTALVTGGVRALEKKGAEKDRIAIFENPYTKEKLLDGIELDVYLLHRVVARLINERTGKEYFYYASAENIDCFEPVCRNILHGNFKDAEQPNLEREQIHNVIMMNPYELRVYCYIMEENGGITAELRELLEYLYVDKASMADSYLEWHYNLSDYTTYESILEFEKVVLAEMEQFGVSKCNYYEALVERREVLYKERRTFHGRVYDTIEERDDMEKQFNEFMDVVLDEMSLDELLEKYDSSYDESLHVNNQEDARAMIMTYIRMKTEDFKSSDEVMPYIAYAQQKKIEHKLETSELVTVFEDKRKALAVKEKIGAIIAMIKGKLRTLAWAIKERSKGLVEKLPIGKKKGKKKEIIEDSVVQEVSDVTLEQEPEEEKTELQEDTVLQKEVKEETPQKQPEGEEETVSVKQSEIQQQPVVVEPQQEIREAPATKVCPQCGATVKATGKFCAKCGYRF